MNFPTTRKSLEEAGYEHTSNAHCRGCGAAMEFWSTPHGRSMPMDLMPQEDSPAISHFATCPEAPRFRRKAGQR